MDWMSNRVQPSLAVENDSHSYSLHFSRFWYFMSSIARSVMPRERSFSYSFFSINKSISFTSFRIISVSIAVHLLE
jgi:hypothetical protein